VAILVFWLLSATGVDLDELSKTRDVQWSCEASTGRHTLHAGRSTVVFLPGASSALVNGAPFALSSPVTLESGRVKLPPELARMVEMAPTRRGIMTPSTLKPSAPAAAKEAEHPRVGTPLVGTTIAIDPGHGGIHTGGKGNNGLLEKDINLGVALNLRDVLQAMGAQVVMTRQNDRHFDTQVDDDLDARVHIVNSAHPDLFLSIHTNYVPAPGVRGFEVWVPRCTGARDRDSRALADLLRDQLGAVWGPSEDRGTKDEHNLRVLKGTHCTAALVELEFVSNPGVERMLGNPGKQHDLAAAIGAAVRRWFGR